VAPHRSAGGRRQAFQLLGRPESRRGTLTVMRSPRGTLAAWAVAELAVCIVLAICILAGCGGQEPAPSPVGVWEVADPEAWARDEFPRLRRLKSTGEPNTFLRVRIGTDVLPRDPRGRADEDLVADLVRIARALLVEFKDDGTFASNFELWLPGTWTANGGRVQADQPWPAPAPESAPPSEPLIPMPPPPHKEYRFDGQYLIWEQDPRESHQVRLRRSTRGFAPPGDPEPVGPDAVPK
jgi:hypothetical protein